MMVFAWLLLLAPLSAALAAVTGASSPWTFVSAILAIVPLAEWVRRATEQLAERSGAAIGSLVNLTFGNAPELALAAFVLLAGQQEVVKAQITGAIIGNSLLGLGLSILVGSMGRYQQRFNRERVSQLSTLMILSTLGLLLPALFDFTVRQRGAGTRGALDEYLSLGVSVVLILVYLANLLYTLVTHRSTFAAEEMEEGGEAAQGRPGAWPVKRSLAVLGAATLGTTFEAHLVSSGLETASASLGVSSIFMGVIVLAIVGNAAEYLAAVSFARQDRIGVSLAITMGSTIQVALLVAPLLVLISWLAGVPMNLVFNTLDVVAVAATTSIVGAISRDGETTWFEGLLLLAVYALFGVAFSLV